MPTPPYLVFGKVKISNVNQFIQNATVTITDTTLNESISVTTNSYGEYTGDLSDLQSAWTLGDGLSITASYKNRSKTSIATISGGSLELDFSLDITNYPRFDLATEEPVSWSALDIMDCDKTFTYNSTKRITKEVADYGFISITRYFTYNSDGTVATESRVVE